MPETKASPGGALYTAGSKVETFGFTPIANELVVGTPNILVKRCGDFLWTATQFVIEKEVPDWSAADMGYLTGQNLPRDQVVLGFCFPFGGVTIAIPLIFYPSVEGSPDNVIRIGFHAGIPAIYTNRWWHCRSLIML